MFNYTGDPSVSDVAAVRFEIPDTDVKAHFLEDEEIAYAILVETTVTASSGVAVIAPPMLWLAAAHCAEQISRKLAQQADSQVGQLRQVYSKQSQTFAQRALELRAKGGGGFAPATGPIDHWLHPEFRRKQFDNPYAGFQAGRFAGLLPPSPDDDD